MPGIRLQNFGGMFPRASRRLLPQGAAETAYNVKLKSGDVVPMRSPLLLSSLGVANAQTLFRLASGANTYWLAWDKPVHVVRAPLTANSSQRFYYSGDYEPRVSDLAMAIGGTPYPNACYVLGVFPPKNACSVSFTGSTGLDVSRAFRYTYVAAWADGSTEESAPSPASSVVAGKTIGTWNISGMDAAPPNSGTISSVSHLGSDNMNVVLNSNFGLRAGEQITIANCAGMTKLNGTWKISWVSTGNNIGITAPGAGAQTYTGSGTWARKANHNTGSMTKNLYWSSGGRYVLVKTGIAVASTSTTVDAAATELSELLSENWVMPPTDLAGLCYHPSGALIGFSGQELCASEPYRPYAWPSAYRNAVNFPITAIGVFGTSVAIATTGLPYSASGNSPEFLVPNKIDQMWPCVAARACVGSGFGVAFPTVTGLAIVGIGGANLATKNHYTKDEWALLRPETMFGAWHDDAYYAAFKPDATTTRIMIFNPSENAALTMANANVHALYADDLNGKLYVAMDNKVYEWDGDPGSYMTGDWLSGELIWPKPMNMGAIKVEGDYTIDSATVAAMQAAYTAAQAANQAALATVRGALNDFEANDFEINGDELIPPAAPLLPGASITLYVDGEAKYGLNFYDDSARRLKSGYKADNLSLRISTAVRISSIVMAETMEGLSKV